MSGPTGAPDCPRLAVRDCPSVTVRRLSGGCLCGATHYEVEDAFLYAVYCHCSQCRRTTGSAFKPLAGIERSKLALVKGADALLIHGEDLGHDAHCGVCGSLLYSVVREGLYVHVAMGTLLDAPRIRPDKHIFVGSKAPWFNITDGLPQFEAFSPTTPDERDRPESPS